MPRYNIPVLRPRGIAQQDCEPATPSLPCARDLVFHLLLARIAASDDSTTEVETIYNPEQNALDIEIPEDILQVLGTIGIGPNLQRFMDWLHPLSTITATNADHTATIIQYGILMSTGDTDRIVHLPAAAVVGDGKVYVIKKIDSGTGIVTINADGSELIDGITIQRLLGQWDCFTIICDGNAWFII